MAEETSFTIHLTLTSEPAAPRIPLKISQSVTAKQLRSQVSEATKIPLTTLRVIVRGRFVADDDSSMVQSFKLEEGSVLHCMGKPVKDEELAAPVLVASTASTVSLSQASPTAGAVAAVPSGSSLQAALSTMRSLNSPADYLTGVTTLDKILSNIASHPMEDKYRRVKVQNAAFQKRLGGLPGGDELMKAIGFVVEPDAKDGEESYCLHASADAWLNLMTCKAEVEQAAVAAKSAAASPTPASNAGSGLPAPAAFPSANAFPGWPAPGGMNLPNMADPAMQQAMAQIMSNPDQFQAMLQNPMVQNAIRRDPRFANDPTMLQGLESLSSNPAMMNQLSQMMQNPDMQRQLQSMMSANGATANPGGGWTNQAFSGNSTAAGVAANNHPQPGTSAVSDEEMTEEEMIAEAIRRSLQDGS